eukprot:CAMPEP_0181176892 /NCGR_PEP_ID=MMETSP1096-20121128/4869_1 /TAXON_ID=156174 ORGANISM="Chrysochromulina ericina, Strain CCMP281" /NCGR_SAMPLE_ID=MMETSP1096 /ASSEMBLY_ACC=CAM_ASM_000453 /LENGTH=58 /DNA_ID=CAMNT_0023265005 /DNA_START=590 /DNA_END=766 /DNA_ORIENTATION=-
MQHLKVALFDDVEGRGAPIPLSEHCLAIGHLHAACGADHLNEGEDPRRKLGRFRVQVP